MNKKDKSSIYYEYGTKRREQQKAGFLPDWYTTNSLIMFEQKYLYEADNFKEQITRIANTLSIHTDDPKYWKDKFYEMMWNGWLSPSTPVLANCGTKRGLPVSCSGGYTGDSVDDFFKSYHEIAMLSKYGFGTSSYISDIRPRGTLFGNNDGKADGVVPVVDMLTRTIRQIRQTSRRGAGAWYLDIEHDDFWELNDYMKNNPDDLNIGWCVKDSFIEKLENKDEEATERYQRALKTKVVTGKGYFVFTDKANKLAPEPIKNCGMPILASQLCLTGNQRVISQYGYKTAKELYEIGGELILFNGEDEVKSSRMKLRGENQDVYRMTLDNGMTLDCTDYHGVPVIENGSIVRRELKDISLGDIVPVQNQKGIFGGNDMQDEAFLLGLYQSDGTQHKDQIHLCLWENDFDLIDEVQEKFNRIHYKYGCNKYEIFNQYGATGKYRDISPPRFIENKVSYSDVKKASLISKTLKKSLNFEKGYVPDWIWESNEETQWQYIRGLLYADGSVFMSSSKGNPVKLAYVDINIEFLRELQLIFRNLGLRSSIRKLRDGGRTLLPDGKGGEKLYNTKDCYRLIVSNKPDLLEINRKTSFLDRKGVFIEDRDYKDNIKKAYKVVSVEYIGKQDVYCPTVETEEHIFISQGMKTFNCTEIFLPSNEEYTYTCVLSSLNLSKWDEWKDTDTIFNATVFLDCVASEFINQAKENCTGIDKAIKFTEEFRALGLGVLGYHTLMQQKMITFESMEARNLTVEIFKKIDEESLRASQWMAEKWGEPKFCKGYGVRNATRLAVAPTMSTALLCGSVSQGIEPVYKNVFTQGSAAGDMKRINPVLLTILKERECYNDDIVNSIIDNKGSVQHLDFLTEHEKNVFKTAFEIDQEVIIRLGSIRGRYIDQGQSLNLFFSADESEKYISKVHNIGFKDPYIKSLYYLRSEAGVSAAKSACEACEG